MASSAWLWAAATAGGDLPLTWLGLAILLLIVTVVEQSRYRLGPFARSWWMTVTVSLVYGLAGWTLSGRLVVGLVLAALTLGARVLLHRVIDLRPPTLWKGLAQTTCVHMAVASAWLVLAPRPAPWLLEAVVAAAAVLTGRTAPSVAAPVDAMIRAVVTVTAYVFVWGSGTVITRAALGLDDYWTGREAGGSARASSSARSRKAGSLKAQRDAAVATCSEAAAEAAAALDQEPMYRWGRLIGNLERFIILTLTLHGQMAAVGFVLAAKSVARFEMMRHHAEYFLVGTLSSTGLALTVGLLVHGLVG